MSITRLRSVVSSISVEDEINSYDYVWQAGTLKELKLIKTHLQIMTEVELDEGDIDDND